MDDLDRLIHHIQGTCLSIEQAVESLELDPSIDWKDKLLDRNIELCGVCNWWHESGELEFDEQRNFGVCEQCLDD
ncbi:hypothetical protein KEU06_09255 [Pseudaminobacter sp. 19-2017]|uniref:Uncharacterized protein n=1 Tax=Pseudaminobacter soli (ex Zhang et al. 2022) TaxID=2831468 RepID=A0A942E0K0_9HYPH|nr:hypothetical protein [Pseudaminobacter soli]MBS3648791.1 hypothetical protein [Pseudaminobacter soli]